MRYFVSTALALLLVCARADAKGPPASTILAEVKSVKITDNRIVIVLSGPMHYYYRTPAGDIKGTVSDLKDVPLTWARPTGTHDFDDVWARYSSYLRDAAGTTIKFLFRDHPRITEDGRGRVTALRAPMIWMEDGQGRIFLPPRVSSSAPPPGQ